MSEFTAIYTLLLGNWILLLRYWYLWKRLAPSVFYDFDCFRPKRCLLVGAPRSDFIFVKITALNPYAYYSSFSWQLQEDRGCWPEASIIWLLAISTFYFLVFNVSFRMIPLGHYWSIYPGGSDIISHRNCSRSSSLSLSFRLNRMTHLIWNYCSIDLLGCRFWCFFQYLWHWFCICAFHSFLSLSISEPFSTPSGHLHLSLSSAYLLLFLNNRWFWRSIPQNRSFRRRCWVFWCHQFECHVFVTILILSAILQ